MLSYSKGIVPQLVNQYNDLIEQNLCQNINLNEFRDNQNQCIDETIVLSQQSIDNCLETINQINVLTEDSKPGFKPILQTVTKDEDKRRRDLKNNDSLVEVNETVCSVKSDKIIDDSVDKKTIIKENENKLIVNKEPKIIECENKYELIPIKVNPILEHLMIRRKHSFVKKTIVPKEICGVCGESIKFSEKYVQCVDCIALSHLDCAPKIPVPCIKYTNPNLRSAKVISNYVYPAFKPSVPALLIHCIREVEERSHESSQNSLYVMKSEELKQVKDLCNDLIKSKNGFYFLKNFNINIICGVIKKFLYDLNESLIGREMWKQFSFNLKKKSEEELTSIVKQSIMELNATNRDSLSFLILHLKHLADNQKYICLDNFTEIFCPIVCGDTEVTRKLQLMSFLLQIKREFWINILNK